MILLTINKETEERAFVTSTHFMPFDPTDGLGKTREELESEGGILIEGVLPPENNGKPYRHYINPKTGEQWYEYEDVPKSEIELLREEFAQYKADQDLLLMQILLGGSPI